MARPNTSVARELRTIRTALRQLRQSFDRLAPLIAQSQAKGRHNRQITITPKRRAALKLQGQYMGLLRGLKPRQQAQVKKVRVQRGVREAIAAAKRFSK